MAQYLGINGGRIAYDIAGEGPLVVLAPGLGDLRAAFRFLAPKLVEAGYRVASVDLRGHGESTTGWAAYSRTDTAGDLLALVHHLGGPACIVGASFAGASAAIAAVQEPAAVSCIVQIDPGTRTPKIALGRITARWIKATTLIGGSVVLRSVPLWGRYYRYAYPTVKPMDFESYLHALKANLREPGRMAAASAMGMSSPADAEAVLPTIACPALVVMGSRDPDFPDPRAEAEGIVAVMPAGLCTIAMIDRAGHYPHAQFPDEVVDAVLPFLRQHAGA
jgi:pimeloyl-ACP methyl ester carboxylesterase